MALLHDSRALRKAIESRFTARVDLQHALCKGEAKWDAGEPAFFARLPELAGRADKLWGS